MKPLEDLLPYILQRALSCPHPVAKQAIIQAARTLCRRSRLWRETDYFSTPDDGFEYTCAPVGAVIFEIESARFEGHPLEPVSLSWLDHQISRWREDSATLAQYITQVYPDTVRVVPMAKGKVELSLTLEPSRDAQDLPDFIFDHHETAIRDGALAEILTIPNQPFTQPELAGYHAQRFERELERLATNNISGQQRAPVRSEPMFF